VEGRRDRRARSQSLPRSWQTQENVGDVGCFWGIETSRNVKKQRPTAKVDEEEEATS